jgi:hypothetical protein
MLNLCREYTNVSLPVLIETARPPNKFPGEKGREKEREKAVHASMRQILIRADSAKRLLPAFR